MLPGHWAYKCPRPSPNPFYRMKTLLVCAFACAGTWAIAQSPITKKNQDRTAIKSLCGCYEVTFQNAETFAPDKNYAFHERYFTKGLEWVVADEDQPGKLVLQHLLVSNDTLVTKHWREDWLHENTDLHAFDRDLRWKYTALDKAGVKGQWTQKVFQVDDSPRYEGSATWIHADGKHYWEGLADSPLPRREFTKRSDYNVMRRTNRHEITAYGWLHAQDNEKIIRTETRDSLLAQEKGLNTYRKAAEGRCQAAAEWWAANRAYWADVRATWDTVFAERKTLALRETVNGKRLYEQLFALGDSQASAVASTGKQLAPDRKEQIRAVIQQFVK